MSGAKQAGTRTVEPDAAFQRALQLEGAGRDADAEKIYRQLAEALPDADPVWNNLALLLKRRGELLEAEACARRAILLAPDKPAYHNTLGVVLRVAGRHAEARAAYEQALQVWPDYPEAYFNLGLLHELERDPGAAQAAFQRAAELKPDYVEAIGHLATLLRRRGEHEAALQQVERLDASVSGGFEAQYYRGEALTALKRHGEAADCFAAALEARPQSLEAALALGNALLEVGRLDDSLDAMWHALQLQPDRVATHRDFNRIAWMAGRPDRYLKSFEFARELRGADPELLQLQASFHLRRQDPAAAEKLLREARTLAPSSGAVAGLLARALAGQQQWAEAFDLFVEAIQREPRESLHRIEHGFALLRAGRAADAATVFEVALQQFPFDQLLLAGLTLAWRQLGDPRHDTLVNLGRYVRVYDLQGAAGSADTLAFNRALAGELERLHSAKVEPIDQTLSGGTQTTGRLFEERAPLLGQLRQGIEAAVRDYLGEMERENLAHPVTLRAPDDVRFAGSWSCWLRGGGYHRNHVHPQGWLSSAYYVRLTEKSDPAQRAGWLNIGQTNLGLGGPDVPLTAIEPVVGRLVLFPSFFWHGTVPFDDGDRLTIAFDVAPGASYEPQAPGGEPRHG